MVVAGMKGFAAGALAGAAAVAVTDALKRALWPRVAPRVGLDPAPGLKDGETPMPSADAMAARKAAALVGARLDERAERRAANLAHYAIAAGIGGLYGAAAERWPGVTRHRGLDFGLAVWAVADEGLSPLLGLSKGPTRYEVDAHVFGLVWNTAYGVLTEAGRKAVRAGMDGAGA